jgi:hypothetical protein
MNIIAQVTKAQRANRFDRYYSTVLSARPAGMASLKEISWIVCNFFISS